MIRNIYVGDAYSRKVVTPLISTDCNSYKIIWDAKAEKGVFKITAVRSDESCVYDYGEITDEGVATYVMASEMYSKEGQLTLLLAIVEDDSVTTCREIRFTVKECDTDAVKTDNIIDPVNTLSMEFVKTKADINATLDEFRIYIDEQIGNALKEVY